MDAEGLAGFTMPIGASAFIAFLLFLLLNADVLTGIAKPVRASASNSVRILMMGEAMSGFVPKCPQGLFEASS